MSDLAPVAPPKMPPDTDNAFAFVFATVIVVVMVGALGLFWLMHGWKWMLIVFVPMVLVALGMLATGRDGPGGMKPPRETRV